MTRHTGISDGAPAIGPTVSRDDFLAVMRGVAHSVTVVTSQGEAGCHGATVSAFASVSADPPTVLVCLHKDSRISQAVLANRQFTVNVLSQDGVQDALIFAAADDCARADRLPTLAPLKETEADCAVASVLHCRLLRSLPEGSHLICIGAVTQAQSKKHDPLLYQDGAFRHLGRAVTSQKDSACR